MLKKEITQKMRGRSQKSKIRIYEAGPMEFCKNFGTIWREELSKKLIKFGYEVFNPANEAKLFQELKAIRKEEHKELKKYTGEKQIKEIKTAFQDLQQAKNLDLNGLKNQFSKIIKIDLREVITSDLIICYWQPGIFSAGTSGELTVAKLFNIPVLMICKDVIKLPKWILGCITEHQKDFKNINRRIKKILKLRGKI